MADFKKFFPHLLKWEGGYGHYVQDTGGCTKYGITIGTWKQLGYDKSGDGIITCEDVKQITVEDAENIYRRYFWQANSMHLISRQELAEIICDWIVNSGAGVAVTRVQAALNRLGENVKVDGILGFKTADAINRTEKELYKIIWKERELFYRAITQRNPNYNIFLQGWLNRLNSFPKEIV